MAPLYEDAEQDVGSEHETKFVFDARRAPHVVARLRARCVPDPVYPAGIVSSIYYDTPSWHSFDEKRNSDLLKTKVRARWYADVETGEPVGVAFLEAKLRNGSRRRKVRIRTDVPAEELAQAELAARVVLELPRLLEAEGVALPGSLLPALEIAYTRVRFDEPRSGARLCVDDNIRVSRTNAARLPHARPVALGVGVLEVKGALKDLPPTLAELRALGCRRGSFSKYAECLERTAKAVA